RSTVSAGAALEEWSDPLRRRLEHRPDEGPHHVPEEAVRRDLELERVFAPMPLGLHDRPRENVVLRLRGREGPEVVLAGEQRGRIGQPRLVYRPRVPPGPPMLERRGLTPLPDPVAVAAGPSRVPRVKVR